MKISKQNDNLVIIILISLTTLGISLLVAQFAGQEFENNWAVQLMTVLGIMGSWMVMIFLYGIVAMVFRIEGVLQTDEHPEGIYRRTVK